MGRGEACTEFWFGNLRERDRWEGDPGVDGKIILRILIIFRRIFSKCDVGYGLD
jgi:hypothetical protein